MKNLISCFLILFFFCIVSSSRNNDNDSTGTVTDIDGNVYKTIKIGNQWWMAENLKVTHYRNSDPITHVEDDTEWADLITGAWCVYDNQDSYKNIYGLLYNWYVVDDSRNIAPEGWHVPTDEEWQELVNHLDGSSVAGGKLKETGTGHWNNPNIGATNASGFSALPGGYRYGSLGYFNYRGYYAYFWSSTEHNPYHAWYRILTYQYSDVYRHHTFNNFGFSVRCLRGSATMIKSSELQTITSPNLAQNYPNPFNPLTTIKFTLPKSEYVQLKVYNILGKKVSTLVSNKLNQGNHIYIFDGKNLASGIYYYQLVAGDYREMKKMILLR
jgi:uncharacterized protein (TIGR02145 family)